MLENENLLEFTYDDEYDENFLESDADFEANNDFDNATDSIASLEDEIYNEIFEGMSDDAIEAEALAVVEEMRKNPNNDAPKFNLDEEVFDDLSDE